MNTGLILGRLLAYGELRRGGWRVRLVGGSVVTVTGPQGQGKQLAYLIDAVQYLNVRGQDTGSEWLPC
jgi:hypothetical protein